MSSQHYGCTCPIDTPDAGGEVATRRGEPPRVPTKDNVPNDPIMAAENLRRRRTVHAHPGNVDQLHVGVGTAKRKPMSIRADRDGRWELIRIADHYGLSLCRGVTARQDIAAPIRPGKVTKENLISARKCQLGPFR